MLIRISHARHFFILSAWSLLSLAAGFRFLGQDKDYLSYVDFYDKLNASLITSLSETRFEPGFVFLGWASKFLLHFDFSLFLLLSASIALSIKIYLLSLRKFTWILLVFYVLILYPLHDMTQIRAAIAMAMTYLAFDFLIKRKWHHAIPLFALGVLFHYSVLIFSPFLLIPLKWLVKQNIASSRSTFWLLILSSSTLLLVFFDPSLFFRVSSSLNPFTETYFYDSASEFNFLSSRSITFFVLVVIGSIAYNSSSDEAKFYIMVSLYGVLLMILGLIVPSFGHRFFELTMFSSLLWITSISSRLSISAILALTPFSLYTGYNWYTSGFL